MTDSATSVAFQGEPGAYSHVACNLAYPGMASLPCASFEGVFEAAEEGRAALAMIPIENAIASRVAAIYHILPHSELHIGAEHVLRVNHCLLAPQGATLEGLKTVYSHPQAIGQCSNSIKRLGLKAVSHLDTAGAAREVAERDDPTAAAIASALAGKINRLACLRSNIEDSEHNVTRFIVLSRDEVNPDPVDGSVITSFMFRVGNIPAALFKALGGFATNGINLTKLESYVVGSRFTIARFYAEIEGHRNQDHVRRAFDELGLFSREVKILGVYPANDYRYERARPLSDENHE